MENKNIIPIPTLHLFPVLDKELISLLRSLTAAEWQLPTIAKLWCVKDIAAHLLDGNLRAISIYRDHYFGEPPTGINSYKSLVDYLNELNRSFTNAAKRLSPQLITDLLESTGKQYLELLQQQDLFADAIFSVAWAGEERSFNWFHIAREYTEKFIHQQQIRDAVGKPDIFTKELFYPFMDTFMYALPHTYRDVEAPTGTVIQIKISTDIGGNWYIEKKERGWVLIKNSSATPAAIVTISPATAWKLFSKGISPQQALQQVAITGDKTLGEVALQLVAVMA